MSDRPAYLTAFRDYIKSTACIDRRLIEAEFYGESDRACGILQASWVELSLEEAIKISLQPRTAKMFAYPEILSSFSAKIDFGYEIKLYGVKTRHDLHLVRELRNGFAHSMVPIKFADDATADLCNNFQLLSTPYKHIPVQVSDRGDDFNTPRNKFVIVCYSIIKGLLDFRWGLKNVVDLPQSHLP